METVGQQSLWSFREGASKVTRMSCMDVRKSEGVAILSYLDLAEKIAELQFMNRDLVLMFRGQSHDHRNKSGNTTLKPSIFRPELRSHVLSQKAIRSRYDKLIAAEGALISLYSQAGIPGSVRLRRQRILRWSILQHYEIVETPLLDVTHSLRIAASFATIAAQKKYEQNAYVFVLGIPNLSGAITASADVGIQMIRLSSICPPSSIRPHIQEGYLLGEYPEMVSVDQTHNYQPYEIDFGRRLVAKFKFNFIDIWASNLNFQPIPEEALYPPKDPMLDVIKPIKKKVEEIA
jgi:hypothetical protein